MVLFWLLAVIPAAVITALRGKWLYFWGGWLTGGILWLIGVFVQEPGDPPRDPRWVLAAPGIAAVMFALGLFGARPAPVLGLDGRVVQNAAGNDMPYLDDPGPCRGQADGSWICSRWDAGLSGAVAYRVEADWKGCWSAVRTGGFAGSSPKELSGCVTLSNYFFD